MPTIGEPEDTGPSSSTSSETDLLNDALGQAGGCARITSIDDGSVNANHCLAYYPALRDAMLRAHFWNFALKWVELAQNTPAPTIGYAFAYQLPGDFLRVKDYAGENPASGGTLSLWPYYGTGYTPNYKIEGRTLRTNDGQAFLQYIRRVTNVAEFDPMFYQAVATTLASKLASAIPKDHKKSLSLAQQGEALLMMAMTIDGQEGSVEPIIVDDLIRGR
jgi:hypothetical protein